MSLQHYFNLSCKEYGNQVAVIHQKQRLTYAQLNDLVHDLQCTIEKICLKYEIPQVCNTISHLTSKGISLHWSTFPLIHSPYNGDIEVKQRLPISFLVS